MGDKIISENFGPEMQFYSRIKKKVVYLMLYALHIKSILVRIQDDFFFF